MVGGRSCSAIYCEIKARIRCCGSVNVSGAKRLIHFLPDECLRCELLFYYQAIIIEHAFYVKLLISRAKHRVEVD
jgi:hypothetical protein